MRLLAPLLVLSLIFPASPLAAGEVIEGTPMEEVAPCCESFPPGTKASAPVALELAPDHSFYDPETLRAMKREVMVSFDVGPGRVLAEGDSELVLEEFLKPGVVPAPKAPGFRDRFEGLDIVEAQHEGVLFVPPDTMVAASGTKVIEATNVALRMSDRSGGGAEVVSLNDFFGELYPPALFDPKIHFDALTGRFFLVAVSVDFGRRKSFLHLAVSRGDDPASLSAPADWCSYRLSAKRGGAWADYPNMGMNERWLAVSFNHFKFSGSFSRVNIFVFDKGDLADNAGSCPNARVSKFAARNDADGIVAFTVTPAQHYSTTSLPGTPLFLASTQPLFTSNRYQLWRLDGGGAKPQLSRVGISGDFTYTLPPESPQRQGVDLDTGDPRVMQAAFRDGRLWLVHATGCAFGDLPNESCVRAVEITPSASGGAITFQSTYGGGRNWYYWMPGVAVNARGDVVVPFQRGRQGKFFGIAVNGKRSTAADFDRVRALRGGRCGLADIDGGGRNRTGDYVGAQTDPADDLGFWIAGEYPDTVPGFGCSWNTRLGRVRYND